jgi:uncharacterized protein with PIN domain
MMGAVFQFQRALQFESCGPCYSCGVEMAMVTDLAANRKRDHKTFFCPNGHSQFWPGESDVEKLQKQLASEKAARERSEAFARAEAAEAKKRIAVERGKITKLKNRVGNGVCPCCNRSFTNLQRHMHTKHPGFAGEGAGGDEALPTGSVEGASK